MEDWIDYYKVLQVHFSAEQEVVESAYKRLCRKYHPDVNKSYDGEEKIKIINMAYEIIGDIEKRKEYHKIWVNKFGHGKSEERDKYKIMEEEGRVIENYFLFLSSSKYEEAYKLISNYDKNTINIKDYVRWQRAVSIGFSIDKFQVFLLKKYRNVQLGDKEFSEVIEFKIELIERNKKNNVLMKDLVTKYIVKEGNLFNIYLGYVNIEPLIQKFEGIANSNIFPTAIEYWSKVQVRRGPITGISNREGFIENIQTHISRNKRYGNIFSIVFLKIQGNYVKSNMGEKTYKETVMRVLGKILEENTRDTDILGIFDNFEFVILMEETSCIQGEKAGDKFSNLGNSKDELKKLNVSIFFGVTEYFGESIEEVIEEARNKAIKKWQP